jgi:hypothetical protein
LTSFLIAAVLLDDLMPIYDVVERHHITVGAAPAVVFRASQQVIDAAPREAFRLLRCRPAGTGALPASAASFE